MARSPLPPGSTSVRRRGLGSSRGRVDVVDVVARDETLAVELLRATPDDPLLIFVRGRANAGQQRFPEAARDFARVAELSLGDAAYRVHYDDYVADPGVLRGMFEWLGEPWDEAAVRAVALPEGAR